MSGARTVSLEMLPGALAAPLLAPQGMRAGISLAAAGDMALSRRDALPFRSRFIAGLGVRPERVHALRQVHSRRVVVVKESPIGTPAPVEADGMITASEEAVLTVTVADCLPICLFDRRTAAFGLVHSGWKGTGIVVEALHAMAAEFGTRPADVAVTIGPGIGPCCYTVAEERALAFASEFGPDSVNRGAGQPRLDLRAANVSLLEAAGVTDITVVSDCTGCTPALGSFRRQGPRDYLLMLAWAARS